MIIVCREATYGGGIKESTIIDVDAKCICWFIRMKGRRPVLTTIFEEELFIIPPSSRWKEDGVSVRGGYFSSHNSGTIIIVYPF